MITIVDRQIDMLSPLVRSFYYGPLSMDLFNIKEKSPDLKIISTKIQPNCVNVDDPIWKKYSKMHIYDAFSKIDEDLREYINTSEVAKFQKNQEEKDPKKMKEVLKGYPEYTRTIKSYETNL